MGQFLTSVFIRSQAWATCSLSLYRKLVGGRRVTRFSALWKARLPPKIKIFMWQAFRGQLPSSDQLHKRNDSIAVECALCNEQESSSHIFFQCHLARFAWICLRSWMGNQWNPSSFREVRVLLRSCSGRFRRVFWPIFSAICWVLWTTRNKFTIEHVFPKHPVNCLYNLLALLQLWKCLIKEEEVGDLEAALDKIKSTAPSLSAMLRHHGS